MARKPIGRPTGRPAYDSKQKLLAAASALLSERGYEATSPQMILQRAGVGQGSMYHHFDGKEDLAVDAIAHMTGRTVTYLETRLQAGLEAGDTGPEDEGRPAHVVTVIADALTYMLERREGQALIRLLADPVVGAAKPLNAAVKGWIDQIRAVIITGLRDDQPGEDPELATQAAAFVAAELTATADKLLDTALGYGLRHLPKWVELLDHSLTATGEP